VAESGKTLFLERKSVLSPKELFGQKEKTGTVRARLEISQGTMRFAHQLHCDQQAA